MSTPDASGTRQRKSAAEEEKNPASLSANPNKKVPREKPKVKPPLADVSMNKFLLYLVLGLTAIGAFYAWRLTVWAADVGGYWNLMTGHRPPITGGLRAAEMAANAAKKAGSAMSGNGKGKGADGAGSGGGGKKAVRGAVGGGNGGEGDIQSQIFSLASALGVTPAELNAAIKPLVDPTAKDALSSAKQELEILKREIDLKQNAAAKEAEESGGPGLLAQMGEVLLD